MMPSALYGPTFSPWMNTLTRTTRATPPLCTATSFTAIVAARSSPLPSLDRGGQRLAPLGDEAPRHERVERRLDGVARRRGEEADPAEIDAEDGGLAGAEQPGAAEEGAVTAEGDERVEIDAVSKSGISRPQNGSSRDSL